jgi:hypothetical protein
MSAGAQRLFQLGLGPHCEGCQVIAECGAEETEHACPAEWSSPGWGGESVLHPSRLDKLDHITALRGLRLSAYKARKVKVPELPGYIPQCRWKQDLVERLDGPIYALRPKAILRQGSIKTAEEVRRYFGLESTQQLVVILFDHDPLLERFFDQGTMSELAKAGYDLIISASFSIWSPRPRMHQLYNMVRSLALCVALQKHGAPAVPRVDWAIDYDIEKWASWLNENPSVGLVAIDAQTSKQSRSWDKLVADLNLLDRLTSGRIHYLINGPTVEPRWAEIYAATSPQRVTFTDASLHHGEPPSTQEKFDFTRADGVVDRGLVFLQRERDRRATINELRSSAA